MDRSLVGYSPNGCKESDTTKWLCACMGAFTLKYDDRILGFHFEHRNISATDSFSFDFFLKTCFQMQLCFLFFVFFSSLSLFNCLKETVVGEISCNRVFLGWLFRTLPFIVKLLWNYSCSPNTLKYFTIFSTKCMWHKNMELMSWHPL